MPPVYQLYITRTHLAIGCLFRIIHFSGYVIHYLFQCTLSTAVSLPLQFNCDASIISFKSKGNCLAFSSVITYGRLQKTSFIEKSATIDELQMMKIVVINKYNHDCICTNILLTLPIKPAHTAMNNRIILEQLHDMNEEDYGYLPMI